jgi:hypothetical protein
MAEIVTPADIQGLYANPGHPTRNLPLDAFGDDGVTQIGAIFQVQNRNLHDSSCSKTVRIYYGIGHELEIYGIDGAVPSRRNKKDYALATTNYVTGFVDPMSPPVT